MKSLLIFIGSIICTAVLFSLPVLAALSFVFNWDNFIKFIMIVLAGSEFIITTTFIWIKTKETEDD